jgi:hypothetical protein
VGIAKNKNIRCSTETGMNGKIGKHTGQFEFLQLA